MAYSTPGVPLMVTEASWPRTIGEVSVITWISWPFVTAGTDEAAELAAPGREEAASEEVFFELAAEGTDRTAETDFEETL